MLISINNDIDICKVLVLGFASIVFIVPHIIVNLDSNMIII